MSRWQDYSERESHARISRATAEVEPARSAHPPRSRHLPVDGARAGARPRNGFAKRHLCALAWYDRAGKMLGPIGEPGDYHAPRISPDGRRMAVEQHPELGGGDLQM